MANEISPYNLTAQKEPDLDSDEECLEYQDQYARVPERRVAQVTSLVNQDGTFKKCVKARRSTFISTVIHLNGERFSFDGRGYLIPIYDNNHRRILLKTGRQVEKCGVVWSTINTPGGHEVRIDSLKPGDHVVGMGSDGAQIIDTVVASESNGVRKCLRITTRLGSTIEITENHPLRKLLCWAQARTLRVGDKIASLRTVGGFGAFSDAAAGLIGLLAGDGHFYTSRGGGTTFGFTQKDTDVRKWFEYLCASQPGLLSSSRIDTRSGSTRYTLSLRSALAKRLVKAGFAEKLAHEKILPDFCFDYDRASTIDLLRGLWATDGHCKNVHKSKVDLVFCSTSKIMARQVQVLLRKLGVVSVIRENRPSNKNAELAYIIRVVTRKSIERFFYEIGPIPGKAFTLPLVVSNSNLDTFPIEAQQLVTELRKQAGTHWQRNGFQSKGLRQKNCYCPTYEKIARFNEQLGSPALQAMLDSDIIWDRIESIESIGEQPTWALQTESQTYISDFVVNHNTTFLANLLTINSLVKPYNKALYVSPSHSQTRQFSNEKLKPVLEQSPLIRRYYQDSFVSSQVFEKGLTNGSYIFLRSAFRTADRARGISARDLMLDEIQDFIGSEIPVIMECTSHFDDASVLMAGTPKSFDNPIEYHWQTTTQNEWIVRCEHCGHQNFLDERNIAPTAMYQDDLLPPGPVCSKCMKHLEVAKHGQWTCFSPGKMIQGYRIPQLMVPWIITTKDQWLRLLWKRDNYPFGQFANEVLGLSYDNASKPISKDELAACCDPDTKMLKENPTPEEAAYGKRLILIGGVDWGEGNDGSEKSPTGKIRPASYTVLTLGTYVNQRQFKVLLVKKYVGQQADPDFALRDIARICRAYDVKLLGVDWGHGWGVNNQLVRILGMNHVVQMQYLPKQKQKVKWDPIGVKYQLLRNLMISELFVAMKNKDIIFPNWRETEPYTKDILSVFVEYSEYQRQMKYDHRPTDPDDFLHSLLYCKFAADIYLGKKQALLSGQ